MYVASLMLLGSGELGREFAIAAKRLGCRVIACDRYENAPAMQLADAFEMFPMLDGKALRAAVEKHKPDVIIPEIEAIDTATLAALESEGWRVAPSAKAVQLTMNRDGIRDCAPVGHRQEAGDYRESWQPAAIPREALHSARFQARKIVEALGGHGIFGVEFFVRGDQAIFSELSPRPHDTGMVTLISQFPNQFELHLRAVLALPIPSIELAGPSASAVLLASQDSEDFSFENVAEALALGAPGRPVD